MEKFAEIIANVEMELTELRRINNQLKNELIETKEINKLLKQENDLLKERCYAPNNAEISIKEAFDCFDVKDDTSHVKLRAYKSLLRNGFLYDYDSETPISIIFLKIKSVSNLRKIRNMGISACALTIIVFEHFGLKFDLFADQYVYRSTVLQITREISEYRNRIVFRDNHTPV